MSKDFITEITNENTPNEKTATRLVTDRDMLQKVKKLSDGKFGKQIVVSGDAQILLQRLMEIYVLVSNHLGYGYSEVHDHKPSDFNEIKLPKYNDKKSRLYFSPNSNPAKAHKNGFNLAIREIKKQTNNTP